MEDVVDISIDEEIVCDVVLNELELRLSSQMGDVCRATGDQVVDADDRVPLRDEAITEMRAEKPGTAGDNRNWHGESESGLGESYDGILELWTSEQISAFNLPNQA